MNTVWLNGFVLFREAAIYADMEKETLLYIIETIVSDQIKKIEDHYGKTKSSSDEDKAY